MTKKIDQSYVSLFTVTPRKPLIMYSVSYFYTKMHRFKAKIPKKLSTPARGLLPFVC